MAATREDDRELDVLERGAAHGHEPVDVVESLNDGPFSQPQLKATTHLTTGAEDNVVVEMNNVHKTYLLGLEGVPALRGVTMTIARGEFVCIFGTSGGGKTSMLNIIGTIDKPTKGDLRLCGTRITARTPDRVLAHIRLHQLGFVFQTFNLLSALTALENVEMPMILAGKLSRAQRRARAKQLLERVGMGARTGHLPSQLSGGEQQRVTIARALANEPSVLLLDEPTGDLDSKNTALVMRLLLELNREGITLIMVTHDMALKWFSDRVIWMRDGKIQRVEIVNEEKRLEVRAELAEECRALDAAAAAKASAPVGTPARAAAGGASLSNTKLRQPRDYKTYHPGGSAPPELLVHSITTANASHVPPPPRSPAAAASGAVSSDEDRSF